MRYANDKKTPNVDGICALCLREARLELGHIWPNWAGRWSKAEGGFKSRRPNMEGSTFGQDSAKHYLLCTPCERLLGDGENRLRLLSVGTLRELNQANAQIDRVSATTFYVGVGERRLISRALLGIALKAHYAPSLSNTIKPDRAVDPIRKMILREDWSGIHVLAAKWYGYTEPGGMNPRAYAGFSSERLASGTPVVHIALAGYDWWVFLGSFPELLDHTANWNIELHPIQMRKAWFENWEELSELVGDQLPTASRGDTCPCGSLRLFEDCCEPFWYAEALEAPPGDTQGS